jgi:hypothetical protein
MYFTPFPLCVVIEAVTVMCKYCSKVLNQVRSFSVCLITLYFYIVSLLSLILFKVVASVFFNTDKESNCIHREMALHIDRNEHKKYYS